MKMLRRLCLALAFAVVGLGAFVRLSDAGLGCPDWPGCYGQWIGVPKHAADPLRAGLEMAHRYLAGTLATGIFVLCAAAWRRRADVGLPTALLLVVCGQALLGMLTVTMRLQPWVVTAHLLGGMTTLSLLAWLEARRWPPANGPALRPWALLAAAALAVQIALGGWVSANYAALACDGFPRCGGAWLPPADFSGGFDFRRLPGDGGAAALMAIHWTHRLFALFAALAVLKLALALWRTGRMAWGAGLAVLVLAQVSLGIANVLLARPLPLAVAHNVGAALLLATTLASLARTGPTPAGQASFGGRMLASRRGVPSV